MGVAQYYHAPAGQGLRLGGTAGSRLNLRLGGGAPQGLVLEALQSVSDQQHDQRHENPRPDGLPALVGILHGGHRCFRSMRNHGVGAYLRPPLAGNSAAMPSCRDRRAAHKRDLISALALPSATVR